MGTAAENELADGTHRAPARSYWLRAWIWCAGAWRDFINLVLPGECVVCELEDHALCPECARELRRQCSAPIRADGAADALTGVLGESGLPVVAAGIYRGVTAAVILSFKNHGRTELGAPLARCLAGALQEAVRQWAGADTDLLLVPIPGTGSGWRRRGYDPVSTLLQKMVSEGRLPPGVEVARILAIRPKLPWQRHHQKGLGRAARRRNVRNTMRIKSGYQREIWPSAKCRERSVVLVDDVLTTGSTLREAARTLGEGGFQIRCAVVIAAARAPELNPEMRAEGRLANKSFRAKDE